LRKYKSPEAEAKDPVARWYVCTTTPNNKNGEYGDAYVTHVKASAKKLSVNPLTGKDIPLFIDWEQRFPIVWLSRQDLQEAGFTQTQIASITNEDMKQIVSRMEDSIRRDDFEDLVYIQTTMVMGEDHEAR